MRSDKHPGAASAPNPEILLRSRILGRVNVTPAVAGVLAGLAFGADRRSDLAALHGITTARISAMDARCR